MTGSAPSKSISFGGSIPEVYDAVLGPVYFDPYAIDIADRVAKGNPGSVLETACGTGIVTVHLKRLLQASITATDINPEMLAVAKTKRFEGKVQFQEADATSLPFPGESFDAVVTQFGLMFFPDRIKALKEVIRVLKPGGIFHFNVWAHLDSNPMSATGREVVRSYFKDNPPATYNVPYSLHDPEEVLTLLKQAGFSNILYEQLPKDCIASSAKEIAGGLVEGNPIVHAIKERDPGMVETVKQKVYETLVNRFGDHPCKTTMNAIVYSAKK